MGEIWKMSSHMEHVIKAYKTLTKIPSIVGGRLNNKGNRVTSRWSIRNLDKGRNTQYFIDYILDDNLGVIAQSDFGTDISHELLTAVSPNESFKAVIREEKDDKDSSKKKFFLEVWSKSCLKHSIDLTSLDIHGDVYADSEFGSLDWSPDEKQIVYVAEKKVKKSEPFIKRKPAEDKSNVDKKPVPGEEHLYREDWGEQLIGKYQTVVVVCNVDEEKFTILENIPENWCPGQVRFTPSGDGIVGVAWDISGVRRLGLIYCTNRPSYIFCSSMNGELRKLSPENKSVRSPRFSPTGDLVWLQREAQGPHHACHQLVKMAADNIASILSSDVSDVTDKISILIDIVQTEKEISNGIFYGIYSQNLPSKGFSADGKRLVFSTQQQNEIRSYVVDIESGNIVDISNNKEVAGSTSVLSVQSDVILTTFSNMSTPGQLFAAKLPSAGDEQNIEWKRISTPQVVPSSIANGKLEYMNLKHENSEDTVSSFTAIYFGPNEGSGHPLVVWPHGGPHSAFVNAYSLEAAFFNLIGFACVLINYRGSAGSGDSSIHFLPGRIGAADVADCKLATDKAVDKFPINNEKLILYGGSHGGFLVAHLSGLHSDVYKATVARNPVIDLASMNNTSDIADWSLGCQLQDLNARCLMGNIGKYDVTDCLLALTTLKRKRPTDNVVIYGGSFGGFIGGHLAKHSIMFKAMILRNPLIDLVSETNYGDIPDGINYRGSTGQGDLNARCLMGNIGNYDVTDCLLALTTAKRKRPTDNVVIYGGSFGGFIGGHLAKHSIMFKAMVLRNPLIDLVTKTNYADNPDGCSVEAGFPFQEGGQELNEKLLALRKVSPIVHANNVTVPTALMLGSKDKRVPYYQGLEYSRKLKANGVHTRVFMYEDNHALSSLPVEMDNLINGADWFIEHIKPIA